MKQREHPNPRFKRAHRHCQAGKEQGVLGNSTLVSVRILRGLRMAHSASGGSARLNRGSERAHSHAQQGAEGCLWRDLTSWSVRTPRGLRMAHSASGEGG